jgi:hypothetical protein
MIESCEGQQKKHFRYFSGGFIPAFTNIGGQRGKSVDVF